MTKKSELLLDFIERHLNDVGHIIDNLKNDVYDDIPEEDRNQIFEKINGKLANLIQEES